MKPAESTTNYRVNYQRKLWLCNTPSEMKKTAILSKTTSDNGKMILFLSIKHTINIVIIRYIVYDDICLMVRKINYFILFILFIYCTCMPYRRAQYKYVLLGSHESRLEWKHRGITSLSIFFYVLCTFLNIMFLYD